MSSLSDLNRIHSEICRLFRLQIAILEKKVFGVASDFELRDYEVRRRRLSELHSQEYRYLASHQKSNHKGRLASSM